MQKNLKKLAPNMKLVAGLESSLQKDLGQTIKQLLLLSEKKEVEEDLRDKILLQSAKFNRLSDQQHAGTMEYQAVQIESAKLTVAVLAIIRAFESLPMLDYKIPKTVESNGIVEKNVGMEVTGGTVTVSGGTISGKQVIYKSTVPESNRKHKNKNNL